MTFIRSASISNFRLYSGSVDWFKTSTLPTVRGLQVRDTTESPALDHPHIVLQVRNNPLMLSADP